VVPDPTQDKSLSITKQGCWVPRCFSHCLCLWILTVMYSALLLVHNFP